MITYNEMRKIAITKERNPEIRAHANTLKTIPGDSYNNLATAVINLVDLLDWFVALAERELKMECTLDNIAVVEHLDLVNRGVIRRNMG